MMRTEDGKNFGDDQSRNTAYTQALKRTLKAHTDLVLIVPIEVAKMNFGYEEKINATIAGHHHLRQSPSATNKNIRPPPPSPIASSNHHWSPPPSLPNCRASPPPDLGVFLCGRSHLRFHGSTPPVKPSSQRMKITPSLFDSTSKLYHCFNSSVEDPCLLTFSGLIHARRFHPRKLCGLLFFRGVFEAIQLLLFQSSSESDSSVHPLLVLSVLIFTLGGLLGFSNSFRGFASCSFRLSGWLPEIVMLSAATSFVTYPGYTTFCFVFKTGFGCG
ncbi:hypothetical protein Tco_1548144 [Tanacetum coccineum]